MPVQNPLECHFAVQFAVERHEDGPKGPLSVRPENPKPRAKALGRAGNVACDPVRPAIVLRRGRAIADQARFNRRLAGTNSDGPIGFVTIVPRRGRPHPDHAGFDRRLADCRQAHAGRAAHRDGRQALFDVVVVLRQMPRDHRLDSSAVRSVQRPSRGKPVSQHPALIEGPGPESRNQRPLIDQPDLQRDQSEQEMSFGAGHEESPRLLRRPPALSLTIRHRHDTAPQPGRAETPRHRDSRMDIHPVTTAPSLPQKGVRNRFAAPQKRCQEPFRRSTARFGTIPTLFPTFDS